MDDACLCVFLRETIHIRKKKQCQDGLFRFMIGDIWPMHVTFCSAMNLGSEQDGEVTENEAPDYALPAQRRGELLRVAKKRGAISVAEIALQFAVSPDTVRRDLDYLAERGLIRRTHGGAVPLDDVTVRDMPVIQRLNALAAEKGRIGRKAATLIVDGETLLVYGGSTTRAFISALGTRRGLTVVTNDLGIPAVLPSDTARAVYVLGGQVLIQSQITLGAVAFPHAGPINVDTAVLGVGGISKSGLSTTILEEASMMVSMVGAARRVIVLADSTKLNRSVFAHIVTLDRVNILVTDSPPPADIADALTEAGVEVILADG
jgi:DeoR/GlpR family transcriptional regulator of sugar metabolism